MSAIGLDIASYLDEPVADRREAVQLTPPAPPRPPTAVADLPEIPKGRGWTAQEIAERLVPPTAPRQAFDGMRRRAHESCNPFGLLVVIGQRPGALGREDQVYDLNDEGPWREAVRTWRQGESFALRVHPLSRGDDPDTSKNAERRLQAWKSIHRIIEFFLSTRDGWGSEVRV